MESIISIWRLVDRKAISSTDLSAQTAYIPVLYS